jgi:hypothetical protein
MFPNLNQKNQCVRECRLDNNSRKSSRTGTADPRCRQEICGVKFVRVEIKRTSGHPSSSSILPTINHLSNSYGNHNPSHHRDHVVLPQGQVIHHPSHSPHRHPQRTFPPLAPELSCVNRRLSLLNVLSSTRVQLVQFHSVKNK